MTTTHRPSGRTRPGTARPLMSTAVIGLVLGVSAAVLSGAPAVWGVALGTVLTVGSLGLGSIVLAWVTDVTPGMSLVVALMTYTLQVVLLLAAYVVLQGSEAARDAVSGPWLGATVIAATVAWLALQVSGLVRARQPYFDLPQDGAADAGKSRTAGGSEVGTT